MAKFKKLHELLHFNLKDTLSNSKNKEETLNQLIDDMEKQVNHLDYIIKHDKVNQTKALKVYEKAKKNSKNLKDKAKLALFINDQEYAEKQLEKKYYKDLDFKEKEKVYNDLNEQAIQLTQQLDVLKQRLEEVKNEKKLILSSKEKCDINELEDKINDVKLLENDNDIKDKSCCKNKSKDIIEAELDRMMDELKSNYKID